MSTARFNEIQQTILDARAEVAQFNALQILTTSEQNETSANSNSKVATWRLWVWIVAFAIWLCEKKFANNITNMRPQNIPNMKEAFLNFRYGLDLVWKNGRFEYDLTNVPDAEERKIIKRCSVIESNNEVVVIKIAVDNDGSLGGASPEQEEKFTYYVEQIIQPGVDYRIISKNPDELKMTLTAYVDTSIIDTATGRLLNVTEEIVPMKDAINSYLDNLEFNGAFVKDHFRSAAKLQPGIKLVTIDLLQFKFASYPFQDMPEWREAEAGHYKISDANLTINYLNYALVNH